MFIIVNCSHESYLKSKLMYFLSLEKFQTSVLCKLSGNRDFTPFGPFDEQIPNRNFLRNVFIKYGAEDYDLRNQIMQAGTGTILKCDHTFKVAKVPNQNGTKLFEALLTVMNEKNLILGYWFTQSKSMEELKPQFAKVYIIDQHI